MERNRKLNYARSSIRGDLVKTSRGAYVKLTFDDGTFLKLLGLSEMKIDKYAYNPEKKEADLNLSVTQATFKFSVGKVNEIAPDRLTIETPTATIGVRGSSGAVKALPDRVWVTGEGLYLQDQKGKKIPVSPGYVYLATDQGVYKRKGEENLFVEGALSASVQEKLQPPGDYTLESAKDSDGEADDTLKQFKVNLPKPERKKASYLNQ